MQGGAQVPGCATTLGLILWRLRPERRDRAVLGIPKGARKLMSRMIAIMNQKGGVGKTTTAINLGAALALRGKRVLLVDLDPQANLTLGLGKRAADLSVSVYELLTSPTPDPAKLLVPTQWERLELLPSHIDLSGAEIEMISMIGREMRLAKGLEPIRNNYDYVLIDCQPSLSLLTVNAMVAAGEVLVPLQAHPFALEGLGKLLEVVRMVREAMNSALKLGGVLVTMLDTRTNVARVTLEALRQDERLRPHLFSVTIKQNIKVAESQKDGVPVVHFDPYCPASKGYFALCDEVLEMENGCLASECAARLAARDAVEVKESEPARGTPAPAESEAREEPGPPPAEPAAGKQTIEAASETVPPNAREPGEEPTPALAVPAAQDEAVPIPPDCRTARAATGQRNSADVEALHPSGGVAVASGVDFAAAAQAALSGIELTPGTAPELSVAIAPAPTAASVYDEAYRPRLVLVPGSCRIPLPPE